MKVGEGMEEEQKEFTMLATILLIFASKKWILAQDRRRIKYKSDLFEKNIKIKKVEKEGDINKFFFRRGAREWYFSIAALC
jgi:hypothetical protein